MKNQSCHEEEKAQKNPRGKKRLVAFLRKKPENEKTTSKASKKPPAKPGKCKTSSINYFIWRGTLCTERPKRSFWTQVWTGNILLPVISWPPQYLASIPYGCTFGCWFLLRCTRELPETSVALTLSPNTIYNFFFQICASGKNTRFIIPRRNSLIIQPDLKINSCN